MTNEQCLAIIETIAMVGRLLFFGITRDHHMTTKEIDDAEDLERFNACMENMKSFLKRDVDVFERVTNMSRNSADE